MKCFVFVFCMPVLPLGFHKNMSPISKINLKASSLEHISPLNLENYHQAHSVWQRDNQPCAARVGSGGEAAVTWHAEMRPALHTDEHFHRHQTGERRRPPRDPPLLPCLLLSCFYLSLMRADTSANIDHGELGKILPAGFWQVITGAGNVCAHLGFSNPPTPTTSETGWVEQPEFLWFVSNHPQKRDMVF